MKRKGARAPVHPCCGAITWRHELGCPLYTYRGKHKLSVRQREVLLWAARPRGYFAVQHDRRSAAKLRDQGLVHATPGSRGRGLFVKTTDEGHRLAMILYRSGEGAYQAPEPHDPRDPPCRKCPNPFCADFPLCAKKGFVLAALVALASCSSPQPPSPDAGAQAEDGRVDVTGDGAAGAPDAQISCLDTCELPDAGGLSYNEECDPIAQNCKPDLTCRPWDNDRSLCRPVGNLSVGDDCSTDGHDGCGVAQVCNYEGTGTFVCRSICDPTAANPCPTGDCYLLPDRTDVGVCWSEL